MSKGIAKIFSCANCGAQSPKWSGRCLECGSWGTMAEELVDTKKEKKKELERVSAELVDLTAVQDIVGQRIKIGMSEADRVFGGGIVPGSLLLLAGEPGIGKSTILAQIADLVARSTKKSVIYASGEESAGQVKGRLERLGCDLKNIKFISATNAEGIVSAARKERPILLIVDSIQTVYSLAIPSEAGSITQIRAVTMKFLELAKEHDVAVMLIGHITKDGSVAGPKTLEHMVDTVVYLEADEKRDLRMLRATKNRFGSVNELGVFEMTAQGFREMTNPAAIFIDELADRSAGSVMSAAMEGTRPFLLEIQALVTKTVFGYPLRKCSGFDANRLQVLSSVMIKRAGLNLANQDIILNIVGGLKTNDTGLDLAVCAAIASSFFNKTIDSKTLFIGEIGLGGEVRSPSKLEARIKEAEKTGYKQVVTATTKLTSSKINIVKIKNLSELLQFLK